MYKNIIITTSQILLLSILILPCYGQGKWELKKEKNKILVYVLNEDSVVFKPYRALTKMEASIHDFEKLLKDIQNMTDWAPSVKKIRIIHEIGDSIQLYYSEAKAPFPFNNRDGIYQNTYRWAADGKSLRVDIKLLADYLPLKDNLVRVRGYGCWIIKDLGHGEIEIFTEMHIDPGGNIPAWLANSFADENPYKTLMNIRKILMKAP